MAGLIKLKKTDFIPFFDNSEAYRTAAWIPVWKRILYSTVFSLNPSPQTTSMDFISLETPIEEVETYKPELPQDIALYEGDPAFDFFYDLFQSLPTGSDAKLPTLLCFGGTTKVAWQIPETTVVFGALDSVGNKLSFTLKFSGDIALGTYTITDGVPVFTPAA